MERIKSKIYADMEKKRLEQLLKDQEEERRRQAVHEAREEYRKAEVEKHILYLKSI